VGTITFECKLDGHHFHLVRPISHSKLKAGFHLFQVRDVDSTSQIDPSPESFEWTIKKGKK